VLLPRGLPLRVYLTCAIIGLRSRIGNMKGNAAVRKPALGPNSADLLVRLSSAHKNVFSIEDAQAITGWGYERTADLLRKLSRKRWLVRLVPGKYLIIPLEAGLEGFPTADRYVIAREVLGSVPYYISHYSAMELHEMTTQPVKTVFVTVCRRRRSRTIAAIEYRFVYASPRSFWGWEETWATPEEQVRVSDLEKTLLDGAVRPDLCGGVAELARGLWLRRDHLDDHRLVEYAKRLGHKAASRRIGCLLQMFGLGEPETVHALRDFGKGGYDSLDPTLPDEGPHDPEWRLRINLDPKELRASVWT
jgi:predicted transcriptional regulator of viral defense system